MLTEEAFAIMNKCGRSPKVIDCLRSYLASKQGAAKISALRGLNNNFMKELRDNPALDSLLTVFKSVYSNIHACPQVIKKCLFYLSIFHQGSSIRRDRLVRRWIAEGYSEGIDSSSMVVYTETKLYQKLHELGMISQPAVTAQSNTDAAVNSSEMTRMSSCQVNSAFMEYITLCEKEEGIFLPLEVTVLKGQSSPNTEHIGQHLAIRDWKGEKAVFDCLDFTRLRSLTVSGEWQPFFVSDMMLVLRVLDLEGISRNLNDGELKKIVEQLPRLKFLSIRGCIEVTRLPRSVGGLRQLQTLDVRGTSIVKLPRSIVKLKKLQCIRASTDDQGGVEVPRGIGALKALHTLGAVDVSHTSSCSGVAVLPELHKHKHLKKLHISGSKRQNILCVCVARFSGRACSCCTVKFPTKSFAELKVLKISCSTRIHVQFAQGALSNLDKVKLYCHNGSSVQFSGVEFLGSSLKQIWLKGPGWNAVRDSLRQQLNQQTPNIHIALITPPEPVLADCNQQIMESGPAQGNNRQMLESGLAEGKQQTAESVTTEANPQMQESGLADGNQQTAESVTTEGNLEMLE